ncbi:MAG: hypothetical protein II794_04995 [Oscillospiraceae bacterium]|nr:hypothetical protein [Oscillospiraceae bacterium]
MPGEKKSRKKFRKEELYERIRETMIIADLVMKSYFSFPFLEKDYYYAIYILIYWNAIDEGKLTTLDIDYAVNLNNEGFIVCCREKTALGRLELDDIKKLFFYTACQSVAYKLWIDYGYSPESALHYVDKSSDIFLRYVLKNQYSIHHFENYQKVREDFDVFTATFEYNFCINSYHNSVSVGDVDFGFEAGHSDAYSEDVRAHLEAQERSKLVKSPLLIYRVSGNRHPYS